MKGGFVVHVGAGDGSLTRALRAKDSYMVHGLDADAAKVATTRESLLKTGSYGPVCVDTWNGKDLPYVEGTVNLVVVEEGSPVSPGEIERVLAPLGVAMVRSGNTWKKTQKPWPAEMDEWTHYYYDAKGNAASRDGVVGPPERLEWLGSPRWSRHHDRMSSLTAGVSSRGRLFYIMDEGSRISILLPSRWELIARDAFNGTILWKKSIPDWTTNLWPLKSGPTQLTRRLVADGERIFVTLGIEAPVSMLDAATGETLKTYPETRGAEEILLSGGVMYALVNPKPAERELVNFAPAQQSDQKRVETEYNWDQKPRVLTAVDPGTGKVLWKHEGLIAPLTLGMDGKRAVFHDGEKLVCLDQGSGREKWSTAPAGRRKLYEFNFGPRVVLHQDVVLYAGGDGEMKGFAAETGKELWKGSHEKSGYRSPEDLIVSGGLVWNAGTLQGNQTGEFTGRDPATGEVKKKFLPDVPEGTYWFHHRCYIAKATDKFLIPSRTGIEFVDTEKQSWDLNHWVRGACLYGVIPANGLTYAGPHNCACYPEAKLFGMNAMAAKNRHPLPAPTPEEARLEKGPAYDAIAEEAANALDWPTYRHDGQRSGFTNQDLVKDMSPAWEVKLSGRLSPPVVAGGKLFISQVEAHTVYAFDADSGKEAWHFTAGSRVDSPPTYWQGRVIFGCTDGNVYCLRASDGALAWRFRAAPTDLRHMALEALESVWPVHGSVLVDPATGVVSFVCGRSVFLDGGLKFFRLEGKTGRKLVEVAYDDKDPATGKDLHTLHKTLQMPTGLNDILSNDGKYIYLRSQKIKDDGERVDIAPVSGKPEEQGGAQRGGNAHIFAAFGYLDAEWFHRSYWVYGEHFAGGHSGYYQAGKYAPAGRILVFDDKNVYSYGRESKYYKWTTTMEHTLYRTSKASPDVAIQPTGQGKPKAGGRKPQAAAAVGYGVKFPDKESLNIAKKALTIECWVLPDEGGGSIVAQGGPLNGFAITLQEKKPAFHVRADKQVHTAASREPLPEGWHHLAAVLEDSGAMKLYVDGKLVAEGAASGPIPSQPKNALVLGAANGVSDIKTNYTGLLDQLVIHPRALTADEILTRVSQPEGQPKGSALICSFDNGDARDESGHGAHGISSGVETGKGKVGAALWFRSASKGAYAPKGGGSFVQHQWDTYVPIVTRAMALAGKNLFVSGPPDTLDEEYAFERLSQRDKAVQQELVEQDAALEGKRGARLWMMNVETGEQANSFELDSPPVWDGMVVARGRLYIATVDGKIKCIGKP